ncbi:hypothetical protein DNAM5_298 [Bacillus phage Vinny]|uniref:Uncharacterized protein n=1 Tax=Bacillus phage Vinny TaxID=1805955 RepID=A0A143FJZ7_9CAUD|nr:hypothetical protein DNAM5_298 [Bacillus phage Vinny]
MSIKDNTKIKDAIMLLLDVRTVLTEGWQNGELTHKEADKLRDEAGAIAMKLKEIQTREMRQQNK